MKKILFSLILVSVMGFCLAACGSIKVEKAKTLVAANGTSAASATADYTGYCGQELADIKQLRDVAESRINFTPQNTTIANLTAMSQVDTSVRTGAEFNTYTIQVNLDSMKAEADSDIHVGVSDGQGHTMIVEFIAPQCDAGLPYATQIAQARANLFAQCGVATSGGFTSLKGKTATITGVAFFDKLHGQFDVAPNGVELHPVLSFSGCGQPPAPPIPNPVTTTTTPITTTTTPNPNNNGVGCKKYPNRHWFNHLYHTYCRANFYTTE